MNALRIVLLAASLAIFPARAELIVADKSVPPHEFAYEHPFLRFLVFSSPETRGQAILPPAPVFVAPPPLLWRAPGAMPPYPPATPRGFNLSGAPSNRDLASYSLARAHAMGQGVYRRENGWSLYFGPTTWLGTPLYGWGAPAYPPVAPGASHPSNRDNASYLIERAHRFSQDAYRKP
ncbi:MAG: hypothetical protein N3C63_10200 [Rhodocyclaceae bacterium]|nr:hypothetical protein [Rhodocyclaceae bacterium]